MAATLRELPAVIEVIEANEDVQAAAKRAVAKTVQA